MSAAVTRACANAAQNAYRQKCLRCMAAYQMHAFICFIEYWRRSWYICKVGFGKASMRYIGRENKLDTIIIVVITHYRPPRAGAFE